MVIDNSTKKIVAPTKSGYKLKTVSGNIVYKSLKKLYFETYGIEYAEDNIKDLEGEEWRKIDEIGRYYVSNYSRVKSYCGLKAKLLKPYTNQKGYYRVDINYKTRKTYLLHRLVAMAFVPNDDPVLKDTVDHIDMNKANNRADNL